jgi:hypothetical protein
MILMPLAEDDMALAKTSGHSTMERRHAPLLHPCHHSSVCLTTLHCPQMFNLCVLRRTSIAYA